jgi:translation initiation factor 2B subunit (eIF-2B alpha/beta/delta family)
MHTLSKSDFSAWKHGTGKYAVVDEVMAETPTYVKGDVKVEDRVKELADEFGVSEQVVWSLYDMMPGELYDGIVTELEDAQHDRFYEDLFED